MSDSNFVMDMVIGTVFLGSFIYAAGSRGMREARYTINSIRYVNLLPLIVHRFYKVLGATVLQILADRDNQTINKLDDFPCHPSHAFS